jgi:hypothetical protein
MTQDEARELANKFGSRMCDENGDTHNQELYCFDLDDIIALKEALAQPEQEPVAWFSPSGNLYKTRFHATANGEQVVTPLYTHPPQRTEQEPICPDCKAKVLYECVACSSNNYPPKGTT